MKAIMLAAALGASAADINFEVENFTAERGLSTVTLKVTNNSGSPVGTVIIDCVFMDREEKAIDIGHALISGLAPGQTKYDQAAITRTAGVEKAHCYVDQVH